MKDERRNAETRMEDGEYKVKLNYRKQLLAAFTPPEALSDSGLRRILRRYAEFCIVGGSGVIVDMGIIYLLASPSMLGWNLSLSKVIAAEVAIFNNFLWNDLWTFRDLATEQNLWRHRLARFLKFNLICVAGLGLSVILLNVQVFWLHFNLYLANFISIVLVSFWNFSLNLRFGWRTLASESPRTAEPLRSVRDQ